MSDRGSIYTWIALWKGVKLCIYVDNVSMLMKPGQRLDFHICWYCMWWLIKRGLLFIKICQHCTCGRGCRSRLYNVPLKDPQPGGASMWQAGAVLSATLLSEHHGVPDIIPSILSQPHTSLSTLSTNLIIYPPPSPWNPILNPFIQPDTTLSIISLNTTPYSAPFLQPDTSPSPSP